MSTTDEVVVEEKKVARGPVFKAAQQLKKYVEGALWTLKWMFDDLWLAIVVAAVMQYFAGHGGDANHFLMSVFLLRGLKLPMEILHCLQNEIGVTLKDSFTKLDYMERRDMKANYLSEDIVRQVRNDVQNYNPSCSNQMWMQRRMRDHYEAFIHAHREVGAAGAGLIWALICTEVVLRACRDIVAFRSQPLKPGQKVNQKTVEKHLKILPNLKITWCDFFKPIGEEEWEKMNMMRSSSSLEKCLKSQILEREDELAQYARSMSEVSAERAEEVFAGMPHLVQKLVKKSSSSAGEPAVKKHM